MSEEKNNEIIASSNLPSVDALQSKILELTKSIPEFKHSKKMFGRTNSQYTSQLMSLTMLGDGPFHFMKQCSAQISNKVAALQGAYFDMKKRAYKIKRWEEKGDELSLINIQEAKEQIESSKVYIDGALKELAVFQEAYEEIRKSNNIPELWDEEDAEMDEIRHHIRQAFRQSHRDMILTGTITQGNAEYLEQYGIHLQTARNYIGQYIAQCEKLIEEGKMPNVDHLYEFLDSCVEIFGEEYIKVMNHIGITELVRSEWLFKNNVNK